jgi:hypothetical protein
MRALLAPARTLLQASHQPPVSSAVRVVPPPQSRWTLCRSQLARAGTEILPNNTTVIPLHPVALDPSTDSVGDGCSEASECKAKARM